MKGKWLAPAAVVSLVVAALFPPPAFSQTPLKAYQEAYRILKEGDGALAKGKGDAALAKYRDSLNRFNSLKRTDPQWQSAEVEKRISEARSAMDKISSARKAQIGQMSEEDFRLLWVNRQERLIREQAAILKKQEEMIQTLKKLQKADAGYRDVLERNRAILKDLEKTAAAAAVSGE